jgi:hypothetical protein
MMMTPQPKRMMIIVQVPAGDGAVEAVASLEDMELVAAKVSKEVPVNP